MIKEWILSKLLKNKVVFFEKDDEYHLINDIYFDDGVVICSYYERSEIDKTEWDDVEIGTNLLFYFLIFGLLLIGLILILKGIGVI